MEVESQQILDSNRAPLGALVSRKLTSAEYREELPGAPAGQYVVLQYDSTSEHKLGHRNCRSNSGQGWNLESFPVLHQVSLSGIRAPTGSTNSDGSTVSSDGVLRVNTWKSACWDNRIKS